MRYLITFQVRNKGFWGFISGMFKSGWQREVEVDLDEIDVIKKCKDAINKEF